MVEHTNDATPLQSVLPGRNVFVTGGLGFIGSHTVLALIESGYSVTIFDNLDNSYEAVFDRMKELAGDKARNMKFVKGDVRCAAELDAALGAKIFEAVIHFAGRKAVGESVAEPMLYYTHNVAGTVNLIEAMRKHNVKKMVFSSSCTVYGNVQPEAVPVSETTPLSACSPYGRSKLVIEDMLRDLAASDPSWRIILLRYFNPVGAHESGRIGEHPVGIPNNLMPYVQQVVLGQRPHLNVFGNDYPTRDGTCIRDYIHVVDLAEGHVAALNKLDGMTPAAVAINLGTGKGTTVMEMVASFEKASGKKVNVVFAPRRTGDSVAVWASTQTAERELGWTAKRDVDDMCADQWRWATMNPKGYVS